MLFLGNERNGFSEVHVHLIETGRECLSIRLHLEIRFQRILLLAREHVVAKALELTVEGLVPPLLLLPALTVQEKKSKAKDKKQEALEQVVEVLQSIEQDYDPLWGSTLKLAIRRVYPGFNESYYGYGSFSDVLEDLQAKKLIELEYDQSRRNFRVRVKKG